MRIKVSDIKATHPCMAGWSKFADSYGDNLPKTTTIRHILKSNGVRDTLWVLDRLPRIDVKLKKLSIDLFKGAIGHAEKALPIFEAKFPNDKRPNLAIKAAKSFLKGKTTAGEVKKCAEAAFNANQEYCTFTRMADTAAYAAASAAHAALAAIYVHDVVELSKEAAYAAIYANNFSAETESREYKRQAGLILKYFG
jgi:hypothetical protein